MSQITILYWRDIPAQVIAGSGRRAAKAVLPARFEAAIDRAAMRSGARESDAYLAAWRRAPAPDRQGEAAQGAAQQIAEALAARLDEEYGPERLAALVNQDGWAERPAEGKGPR
ncbi:virulence factor [Alloyangia pacifica]|uniref:virulence factor n=1 Tax=Alloyangia pacifica TaxID=311180 RepID=UPI001CFD7657|nr:virulence factor [Alloyangia pacifica]